jgi:hypothetical protein
MERHEFLSKLRIGVVAVCAGWCHAVPKAAIQIQVPTALPLQKYKVRIDGSALTVWA